MHELVDHCLCELMSRLWGAFVHLMMCSRWCVFALAVRTNPASPTSCTIRPGCIDYVGYGGRLKKKKKNKGWNFRLTKRPSTKEWQRRICKGFSLGSPCRIDSLSRREISEYSTSLLMSETDATSRTDIYKSHRIIAACDQWGIGLGIKLPN